MEFITENCDFLVLVKLPNGNVHQVQLYQEDIKTFIKSKGFLVYEEKVEGIDFELPIINSKSE